MRVPTLRIASIVATALVAAAAFCSAPAKASDGLLAPRPRYDLFYNFYVGPSIYGGQPAQLYVSPRPYPSSWATPTSPTSR